MKRSRISGAIRLTTKGINTEDKRKLQKKAENGREKRTQRIFNYNIPPLYVEEQSLMKHQSELYCQTRSISNLLIIVDVTTFIISFCYCYGDTITRCFHVGNGTTYWSSSLPTNGQSFVCLKLKQRFFFWEWSETRKKLYARISLMGKV